MHNYMKWDLLACKIHQCSAWQEEHWLILTVVFSSSSRVSPAVFSSTMASIIVSSSGFAYNFTSREKEWCIIFFASLREQSCCWRRWLAVEDDETTTLRITSCLAIEKLCTLATEIVAINAPTQEAANLIARLSLWLQSPRSIVAVQYGSEVIQLKRSNYPPQFGLSPPSKSQPWAKILSPPCWLK